jgi:hypothetical protein
MGPASRLELAVNLLRGLAGTFNRGLLFLCA